jgi:hypothetical protein
MKKYRALQIMLELAEKNMIDPEYGLYASDDTVYDKMLVEVDAYHTVYRMLKDEVEKDKTDIEAKDIIKMLRKLDDNAEPYKVPAHLRGEIDLKELKKDLDKLNEPLVDGMMNMCYGDGYFQNSLEEKYGKSIIELEKMVKNIT